MSVIDLKQTPYISEHALFLPNVLYVYASFHTTNWPQVQCQVSTKTGRYQEPANDVQFMLAVQAMRPTTDPYCEQISISIINSDTIDF